ncbi:plasma membrane ATPase [Zopfochytrium polystomum]|nr:plasma membrane ATPase [Zopfochytrium polystomum]
MPPTGEQPNTASGHRDPPPDHEDAAVIVSGDAAAAGDGSTAIHALLKDLLDEQARRGPEHRSTRRGRQRRRHRADGDDNDDDEDDHTSDETLRTAGGGGSDSAPGGGSDGPKRGGSIEGERANLAMRFLGFFVGPIQFVMIAAAALAGGLQEWVDLGVIAGPLLLNATVGFVQEFHAGNIVAELKSQVATSLAHKAHVVREGTVMEVDSADLVPGDIVKLDEGTIVPADGRILGGGGSSVSREEPFLQVDQSALTGESLAVEKHRGDELFASSAVKRGDGTMIVTATGDGTFVGRTASLTQATEVRGKFTEVLRSIGSVLLVLVIFWILIIWISGFFRSLSIVDLLRYSLIITVIGVPVGLPAVVTTTLAVGAAYLARRKAIVQRLSAIESLAGVEILCSDKTGTLTKNKLVLQAPLPLNGSKADDLILASVLAASRKKKGLDAIDRAIILSLFQPFDPVTKRVVATVRNKNDGKVMTCAKGAPGAVLRLVEEEQGRPPDRAVAEPYHQKVSELARRGFRSLGVAWKTDGAWTEAKALGLRIKMLTGDAVGIARETARQLRLGTKVYDARILVDTTSLPGSELNDFIVAADGFAEVFPEHKYKVVDVLQKLGYLVAMTGDGVNDAPSLKRADTGIAVEGSSDAARTAADIVFLAPGLSAIIHSVKTARQIFHRMYAYVVYRIALSLHLEIFLTTSLVILNRSLNVNLIVFLAIFADVATLAIAYDHATFSMTPVKWDLPKIWGLAITVGVLLAVGTWIVYGTLLMPSSSHGIIQERGNPQGILFLQIALTENWLIFVTRSDARAAAAAGTGAGSPFLPSWQLVSAVLAVDVLATLFCVFGWFVGPPVRPGFSQTTDVVTVVRVWLYSFGVMVVVAFVYFGLERSKMFQRCVKGRIRRRHKRLEDFVAQLERVSVLHEAEGRGRGQVQDGAASRVGLQYPDEDEE